MFGVPPEHSAIGNIHRDILLLCVITLQNVIQNNCRRFNGAFWWYGPLSEDRENIDQIYQNYLVALTGWFQK